MEGELRPGAVEGLIGGDGEGGSGAEIPLARTTRPIDVYSGELPDVDCLVPDWSEREIRGATIDRPDPSRSEDTGGG